MDSAELDPATYARVLTDLSRISALTLAARPTLDFLDRVTTGRRSIRLLDVGFGHGDMLRRIARWSKRRGLDAELIGVDLNPNSADAARAATPPDLVIDYRTGDYRDIEGRIDVVVSSLVAHHMTDGQLQSFLRFMDRESRLGWLVNDLRRHWFSHAGYPLLARLAGVHRIVREDGQLSIARGFRESEWHAILAAAGIDGARIVPWFPYRLCVERAR